MAVQQLSTLYLNNSNASGSSASSLSLPSSESSSSTVSASAGSNSANGNNAAAPLKKRPSAMKRAALATLKNASASTPVSPSSPSSNPSTHRRAPVEGPCEWTDAEWDAWAKEYEAMEYAADREIEKIAAENAAKNASACPSFPSAHRRAPVEGPCEWTAKEWTAWEADHEQQAAEYGRTQQQAAECDEHESAASESSVPTQTTQTKETAADGKTHLKIGDWVRDPLRGHGRIVAICPAEESATGEELVCVHYVGNDDSDSEGQWQKKGRLQALAGKIANKFARMFSPRGKNGKKGQENGSDEEECYEDGTPVNQWDECASQVDDAACFLESQNRSC